MRADARAGRHTHRRRTHAGSRSEEEKISVVVLAPVRRSSIAGRSAISPLLFLKRIGKVCCGRPAAFCSNGEHIEPARGVFKMVEPDVAFGCAPKQMLFKRGN